MGAIIERLDLAAEYILSLLTSAIHPNKETMIRADASQRSLQYSS